MKVKIEETIYEGSGTEIIDRLRRQGFHLTELPDAESYIRFLQGNIIRTTGMDCLLPNRDTETRARTILAHLAKIGGLELLEEL